jgi:hypothetical protein
MRILKKVRSNAETVLVLANDDGSYRVARADGAIIATELSNAQAWKLADSLDAEAARQEETRVRIGDAMQW